MLLMVLEHKETLITNCVDLVIGTFYYFGTKRIPRGQIIRKMSEGVIIRK